MREVLHPAEQAMRSLEEYESCGPNTDFLHVPLNTLKAWVPTLGASRLDAELTHRKSWLLAETALTAQRNIGEAYDASQHREYYDPLALLTQAKQGWEQVAHNAANPAAIRSRALLASGAADIYRVMILGKGQKDVPRYYATQVHAGDILFNAYKRYRKDPNLLHDMYLQTTMMVINAFDKNGVLPALPLPTRLRQEGEASSCDFALYGEEHLYFLKVSAYEGRLLRRPSIAPSLLANEGYPCELGQGTMRAFLTSYKLSEKASVNPRQAREYQIQTAHMKKVHEQVMDALEEQLEALDSAETIDVSRLTAARAWYLGELGPNYHFDQADRDALLQCINSFEAAAKEDTLSPEDMHTLGWLWVETAALTSDPAGFERAIHVFQTVAETATAKERWYLYFEARLGEATAQLYHDIQTGEASLPENLKTYRYQLGDVAYHLLQGFTIDNERSDPQHAALLPLFRRLTACLLTQAVTADIENVAVLTSPREQGILSSKPGSDIHVIACQDGKLNANALGKIRIRPTAEPSSLAHGIVTLTPESLAEKYNEQDLLQLLVEQLYTTNGYEAYEVTEEHVRARDIFLERLAFSLLEAAETSRAIPQQ